MDSDPVEPQWYSVRCVFQLASDKGYTYEERLTLWQADSFDQAVAMAEDEAGDYAKAEGVEYLYLAQAYWLPDDPASGAEIFSLARDSALPPTEYLNAFFDTGEEHQRDLDQRDLPDQ